MMQKIVGCAVLAFMLMVGSFIMGAAIGACHVGTAFVEQRWK